MVVTEIILDENDKLDWALKAFRRKVQRAGIFRDIKKNRFYEKPSEARRRKMKAAERRRKRRKRRAATGR